jgi:hypothetical protein
MSVYRELYVFAEGVLENAAKRALKEAEEYKLPANFPTTNLDAFARAIQINGNFDSVEWSRSPATRTYRVVATKGGQFATAEFSEYGLELADYNARIRDLLEELKRELLK